MSLLPLTLIAYHENYNILFKIKFVWVAVIFIYNICSVAAAGYIINDLFDIQTDRINKAEKVIVGKSLSFKQTTWLYLAFVTESLIIAAIIQWATNKPYYVVCVLLVHIALFAYAKYFKKSFLFGNMLVAFIAALPFLLFAYLFSLKGIQQLLLVIIFSFVFMLHWLREIIKDWEDMPGDKTIHAKTLPIVLGINQTKKILYILVIVSLLIHTYLPTLMVIIYPNLKQFFKDFWLVYTIAFLHLPLLYSIKNKTPKTSSNMIKGLLFLGVFWLYYLVGIQY
jgi:4-hydroxybenzoate polyprenyltransferase